MSTRSGSWLALVVVFLVAISGCSTPPTNGDAGDTGFDIASDRVGDTGVDVATVLDVTCTNNASCDNHVFCDGVERCAPSDPAADVNGCAPAAMPACAGNERCDESSDACFVETDGGTADGADGGSCDDDHDGVRSLACGGGDCDDNDPLRYPGNPERCGGNLPDGRPAAAHDEDCNPCTVTGTSPDGDADADGFPSASCTNPWIGALMPVGCDARIVRVAGAPMQVTGSDCTDSDGNVRPNQTEVCNSLDDNCNAMTDEGVCTPCPAGFSGWDGMCTDIDECAMGQCGVGSATCTNTAGTYACTCMAGFTAPATGGTCTDVDECAAGTPCGTGLGACTNTVGSYSCTCNAGFDSPATGGTCADIDECATGAPCGGLATACTNTTGAYSCECLPGYGAPPSGGTCADIDECAAGAPCGAGIGMCTNLPGTYSCTCSAGYVAPSTSGGTCVDVDECAAGTPCGTFGSSCTNTPGTYACTCLPGYAAPATGGTCVDIDECSIGTPCGAGIGSCTNTPGSYACTCNAGYTAPTSRGTCTDIDECATGTPCGGGLGACTNTAGSYVCSCNAGYAAPSSGGTCADIDECAAGTPCGAGLGRCRNTPGAYACSCNAGYLAPPSAGTCTDIDECATGTPCGAGLGTCTNAAGSYACACIAEYAAPATGGHCSGVLTPRPVAPLSTSTVTSRRPNLRWVLAAGTLGAHVQICRDRACTTIVTEFDVGASAGAPAGDLPVGVLFWRLAGLTSTGRDSTWSPVWQFTVGWRTAPVNTSWGSTIDVNGDGFADVVVGADSVGANEGRAYVYFGSASGLSSTPSVTLVAPEGGAGRFGCSVASAGDVNGDGFGDVLVGAYALAANTGRAYLFLGSASGLASTPSVTLAAPDGAGGNFGQSVAAAGDVNGDGYADTVVGAFAVASNAGRAYVYLGSASGLVSTPATTLAGAAGSRFGGSVASAGDLNGDGYADTIVGASAASGGRAFVYLGSAAGVSTTPTTTLTSSTGSSFGAVVASAGDVNGDGYADVLVSDPPAVSLAGRVYVYSGSASGVSTSATTTLSPPTSATFNFFGNATASAGDVNADGFDDVIVGNDLLDRACVYLGSGSGLVATVATTLATPDPASSTFGGATAHAGDVNGDGRADVIVGASGRDRAYLYLGTTTGVASTPMTTLTAPDPGRFGASVASVTRPVGSVDLRGS